MKKNEKIFVAATGFSLARAEKVNQEWVVSHTLENTKINCIVKDPKNPQNIFLGTQNKGVFVSRNAGKSWDPTGLADYPVKSLAIDPSDSETIYAGCKPVSLFVSRDGGKTWEELPAMRETPRFWWFSPADPPGMAPYVKSLAVSPTNSNVILAGIEAGAVLRSDDGGLTWSKHLRGSDRDCHSLKFHLSDGNWVYQGGGGGVSFSRDGGKNWRKPKTGLGPKYGWMIESDPERPEIWYLTASDRPNLLKGQFHPLAHIDGQAQAHIYRKIGDDPWVQLSGGLPEPLDYMAFDLAIDPDLPGYLFAGLANGQVWFSEDYGDQWEKLPFNLGGIHDSLVVV
jgi:hypothetical protein